MYNTHFSWHLCGGNNDRKQKCASSLLFNPHYFTLAWGPVCYYWQWGSRWKYLRQKARGRQWIICSQRGKQPLVSQASVTAGVFMKSFRREMTRRGQKMRAITPGWAIFPTLGAQMLEWWMSQMLRCSYCLELLDKSWFGPQNLEGVVEATTEHCKETHNDGAGMRQSARACEVYSFSPRPCVSIQYDTKIVRSQSFCFIVQQLRCNSETTEPITGTLQAGRFTTFILTLGTTVFVLHLFLGKATVALAINKVKAVQEMIVRFLVRRRDCGGCVK